MGQYKKSLISTFPCFLTPGYLKQQQGLNGGWGIRNFTGEDFLLGEGYEIKTKMIGGLRMNKFLAGRGRNRPHNPPSRENPDLHSSSRFIYLFFTYIFYYFQSNLYTIFAILDIKMPALQSKFVQIYKLPWDIIF